MSNARARLAALAAVLLLPLAAKAEVHYACTFPSLPSFSITYPEAVGAKPLLQVQNRPPVEMTQGSGSNRIETGTVDGYRFQFVPKHSHLEVRKGDEVIGGETGRCVRIGGPVNETPLVLVAPAPEAPEAAPTAKPDKPGDTGSWLVSQSESQFDDTPLIVLRLESRDVVRGKYNGTATPSLILRCMENTTSMFINPGGHFLSDIQGYGKVTYRIDDLKAASWRMSASTDNEVLGLWSGSKSIPQIKKLIQGNSLLVRLTPYNESALEFGFDLAGLNEAIKPLRKACNW
ncbi:hypothetical protein FHY55_19910 [Oceanicola sp. D3]|uniref:type VI secretion system-associated protein TagO n=1 Tax=Oceanicola sp. D3 TaxID=2587163 RepID=UPI00111FFE5C|nr:type VI secretion system-associated protein TagO [Oceanicola sp. D3]QDC11359.1 hypothetical protein FHY55_19910 [Oceanicola sp. D3]